MNAAATDPAAFDFGALIQTIATIVALVGVIVSFWIARRGQKQDLILATAEAERAERAEKAGAASAERAENAAALTIDSMSRMADALDKIAAQEPSGHAVMATTPRPRVAWSLNHRQNDSYLLTNIGDSPAYDVVISAHESMLVPRKIPTTDVLQPGEAVSFVALRTMGTSDSTITVEWSDEQGGTDRGSWRYPLPPKPRG
ncbi:MAG TPA: hypothetical protein VIP50_05650 [Agromyces sp.]